MVISTKPPSGRISDPPYTIRDYDPESFKYLNDLVRELEIAFRDVIEFIGGTNQAFTSVNINTAAVLSSLSVINAAITVINATNATQDTQISNLGSRVTSVNNRLTAVSATLENRISAVSTVAAAGGVPASIRDRLSAVSAMNTVQNGRLTSINENVVSGYLLINTLSNRITSVNENTTSALSRIATVSAKGTSVNTRLVNLSATLENRISIVSALAGSGGVPASIRDRLSAVSVMNTTQNGRLTSINENVVSAYGRINTLSVRITSVNENATSALSRIATVSGKLTSVNSKLTTTSARITSVNSRVATVSTKLTSVNENATSALNRIIAVSGKLTSVNSKLTTASARITSVNENVVSAYGRINTVSARITSINENVTSALNRIATVSSKLTSVNENTTSALSRIATVSGKLTSVNSKLTTTSARITSVNENTTSILTRLAAVSALANDPFVLTGNRTYYVAASGGSDSNTGLTSALSFATIQKAINTAANLIVGPYNVSIVLLKGTHLITTGITTKPLIGSGVVVIKGTATTSVVISGDGSSSLTILTHSSNPTLYTLKDVTISRSGTMSTITGITCAGASQITLNNVNFTTFGSTATTRRHLRAVSGGIIAITGSYSITGSFGYHLEATFSGTFTYQAAITVTLNSTPGFNTFAVAQTLGVMNIPSTFPVTFSGASTGTRYSATLNAIINTAGGGASYLPGNAAGSTATGGQYA